MPTGYAKTNLIFPKLFTCLGVESMGLKNINIVHLTLKDKKMKDEKNMNVQIYIYTETSNSKTTKRAKEIFFTHRLINFSIET